MHTKKTGKIYPIPAPVDHQDTLTNKSDAQQFELLACLGMVNRFQHFRSSRRMLRGDIPASQRLAPHLSAGVSAFLRHRVIPGGQAVAWPVPDLHTIRDRRRNTRQMTSRSGLTGSMMGCNLQNKAFVEAFRSSSDPPRGGHAEEQRTPT